MQHSNGKTVTAAVREKRSGLDKARGEAEREFKLVLEEIEMKRGTLDALELLQRQFPNARLITERNGEREYILDDTVKPTAFELQRNSWGSWDEGQRNVEVAVFRNVRVAGKQFRIHSQHPIWVGTEYCDGEELDANRSLDNTTFECGEKAGLIRELTGYHGLPKPLAEKIAKHLLDQYPELRHLASDEISDVL